MLLSSCTCHLATQPFHIVVVDFLYFAKPVAGFHWSHLLVFKRVDEDELVKYRQT